METERILKKPAVEMIDEGLRQYMIKIFNYMGLGLCITALSAYLTANTFLLSFMYNFNAQTNSVSLSLIGWIVTLAPLIMIFVINSRVQERSLARTHAYFWLFSALMGASLSLVCLSYTSASLVRVFLITAATFGAVSLYGYTTNRDLTKIGSFLFMGLIGLIIATIVNIFIQSPALYYALSYIGIAIFVGLTAYDTQKLKNMYYAANLGSSVELTSKIAIVAALDLYLDFINLFLYLLRFLGDRR